MRITPFDVAVAEYDTFLSCSIEERGRLDVADGWLQQYRADIPKGGIVADVGACLGDHTLSYARMVGPTGHVYAFEPNPIALECLRYNMRACLNVTIYANALGRDDRARTVERNVINLGASRLLEDPGPVQTTTLDTVAPTWPRLDFLKIDVEGFEPDVLDGGVQTIRRLWPVMLMEVNVALLKLRGYEAEDIYQRLDSLGYSYMPCRYGDTLASPEIDIACRPMVAR